MSNLYDKSAIKDPESLRRFISSAGVRPEFSRVMMVDPKYFQVQYEINPHMAGRIGTVDPAEARSEWTAIKDLYEVLGYETLIMPGAAEYPDLVFIANQILPTRDWDGPVVILSRMTKPERRGEVALVRKFLESQGIACEELVPDGNEPAENFTFEGTGDGIWHPKAALLWGGYGFRTTLAAWGKTRSLFAYVIPLRLVDERCYHLDVCLMPINQDTAFACRAAFDGESWARLSAGFANLIAADENETMNGFALNGHCPDGENLLLPAGNPKTRAAAEKLGLIVHELSTREFQKSGGSIFCLKNMLPGTGGA